MSAQTKEGEEGEPTMRVPLSARKRVLVPTSSEGDAEIYQRTMTTNKFKEVNRLSEPDKVQALQAVFENNLGTEERKSLTAKIEAGQSVETATNAVLLRRETTRLERYAERKRREECPTCHGEGYILRSERQ